MTALAVVKNGPETLDERLAAAQWAEIAPRKKVDELTAALTAAVEAGDYAAADKIQGQLPAAREALALAEVEARVLRESRQALDAQLEAERRELGERQRREEAQRAIGEAMAADKRACEHVGEHVGRMYDHLEAALAEFREAQACERAAGAERRRMWQGRADLGEIAGVPRWIQSPNDASILAEMVPLIRELRTWKGPEDRPPRPAVTSAASAPGAGPLVRQSPFR